MSIKPLRRPSLLDYYQSAKNATLAMWRNYQDMKIDRTIHGDKYFHCKANCEAARHQPAGPAVAATISIGREVSQQLEPRPVLSSHYKNDFQADQIANHFGRNQGANPNKQSQECKKLCPPYRVDGINSRY